MNIYIQKLILIFARISSFMVLFPVFSFKGIPGPFKVMISMGFSYIIYLVSPEIEIVSSVFLFGLLIVKEIALGLSIGYISQLIFGITDIAGQLVDFQVGFSMASAFDASMGTMASNYGKVYYWMSVSIFFILDIHHLIIESVLKSFDHIPIGMVDLSKMPVLAILELFARVFELGFNLAAPIIVVVLLTDIILGIISRTIPQINVLMLGMPLKASIGFIISSFLLAWLMKTMAYNMATIPKYIESFYRHFVN